MPPFCLDLALGLYRIFVPTATQKSDEKSIHRKSDMKKLSTVLNTQTEGSKKQNLFPTVTRKTNEESTYSAE